MQDRVRLGDLELGELAVVSDVLNTQEDGYLFSTVVVVAESSGRARRTFDRTSASSLTSFFLCRYRNSSSS